MRSDRYLSFGYSAMFETRLQTYWADADPAQIVFFANFFRFVQCTEEELFRAAGKEMMDMFHQFGMSFPRVESFAKFSKPIYAGEAIFMQMQTHFKGEKTVRMEFKVLSAKDRSLLAEGYVTAVCVNSQTMKSCPMPEALRAIYALAAEDENS